MMGQEQVLRYLTKNKGVLFKVCEIAKHFNLSKGSVTSNCLKLHKNKFISRTEAERGPTLLYYVAADEE